MSDALEKRIKKHVIGKPHRFLAVAPLGFEQTLVQELQAIGVKTATESNDSISSDCSKKVLNPFRIVGDGKVEFTTKLVEAWKAVAYSRIANRILMHIADFKAESFRDLEKKASEIPWELYLEQTQETSAGDRLETGKLQVERLDDSILQRVQDTVPCVDGINVKKTNGHDQSKACEKKSSKALNIHVTCKHSRLYHSDAIAERLYRIIEGNTAPKQNGNRCNQQNLYVHFLDDRCTFWLDLAGEELYRRGHDRFVNEAPLKETIAAAMIFEAMEILRLRDTRYAQDGTSFQEVQIAQMDNRTARTADKIHSATKFCLLDLMSGSGTFSLEAAYAANGFIPGKCRDFALMHQPAFKNATWKFILNERRDDYKTISEASKSFIDKSQTHQQTPNIPETKVCTRSIDCTTQNSKFYEIVKIITSDISNKAVEIISHNVKCSPIAQAPHIANNPTIDFPSISPQIRDFFSFSAKEISDLCGDAAPIIVLNPPYGKRLDFDAPKLYARIGKKITELADNLKSFGKELTVAILAPKDDTRDGSKYTCTTNLLYECPAIAPEKNPQAKCIATSHGGFSLNAFIAIL